MVNDQVEDPIFVEITFERNKKNTYKFLENELIIVAAYLLGVFK